jgi:NADPH:quinone reductase-like Zn-dependent oxidoreductase
MKAILRDKYRSPDALELKDIDKPVLEKNEVLI